MKAGPDEGSTRQAEDAYRQKVDELVKALNTEGAKNEAGRILRGLLSEIRLLPEADGMAIELVGELAAIMALEGSKNTNAAPGGGSSVSMVAGACNSRFLRLVESVVPRLVA